MTRCQGFNLNEWAPELRSWTHACWSAVQISPVCPSYIIVFVLCSCNKVLQSLKVQNLFPKKDTWKRFTVWFLQTRSCRVYKAGVGLKRRWKHHHANRSWWLHIRCEQTANTNRAWNKLGVKSQGQDKNISENLWALTERSESLDILLCASKGFI